MYKTSKFFLPVLAVSVLAGCSQSDSAASVVNDVLNKNSVALSGLDQNVVTYEKVADKTTHTDVYCPNGLLGDKVGKDGNWTVAGNDLTVNNNNSILSFTYQTTNATLEKDKSYNTTTGETFKVIKISETICL